jgi:hypothetical protein
MAERTKKTILRVETARASAKTISGISQANPGVVSSTGHGYAYGDIIYLDGIVGMTELNDRAFVAYSAASPTPANSFELRGENTTNYTAYASGGNAYKLTMTKVGEVTNITLGGGGTQQIDVTNLESDQIEQLAGLPNLGSLSFDVTLNHTDTGQAAFRDLFNATTPKVITLSTASGYTLCATGYAANQSATFPVNDAQRGSFEFTIYRKVTWFA